MKYNYISIPKTASQAIHRALNITNVSEMNHVSVNKLPERFTFTFVREPLERLVSWWRYHKSVTGLKGVYLPTFEAWVNAGFPVHWDRDFLIRCGVNNPLNQWEFVCKNGLIHCDFIGLYEDLDNDFKEVSKVIGVNKKLELVCPSIVPKPIVSEKTKTIIKNKFKIDYELYEHVRTKRRGLKGLELF
jgi:hypothetical protein